MTDEPNDAGPPLGPIADAIGDAISKRTDAEAMKHAPLEDQPAPPLSEEEQVRIAREEAAILVAAAERFKEAFVRSLPRDKLGQPGINPVQLAFDVKVQQIRLDALMMTLEGLGASIMLPATRAMVAMYNAKTEELGRIQIARGVGAALKSKN